MMFCYIDVHYVTKCHHPAFLSAACSYDINENHHMHTHLLDFSITGHLSINSSWGQTTKVNFGNCCCFVAFTGLMLFILPKRVSKHWMMKLSSTSYSCAVYCQWYEDLIAKLNECYEHVSVVYVLLFWC